MSIENNLPKTGDKNNGREQEKNHSETELSPKTEIIAENESTIEIKNEEKIFNSYMYNLGIDFVNSKVSAEDCFKKFRRQCLENKFPVDDKYSNYREFELYEISKGGNYDKGLYNGRYLEIPGYQENKEKWEKWMKVKDIFYFSKLFVDFYEGMDFESYIVEFKKALKGKKILEIGPGHRGGRILSLKKMMGDEIEATIIESVGTTYSRDGGYSQEECEKLFKDNDIDVILDDESLDELRANLQKKDSFDLIICQRVFYDGDCGSMSSYGKQRNSLFELHNSFLKKGGVAMTDPPNYYSKPGMYEMGIKETVEKYKLVNVAPIALEGCLFIKL